MVNHALTYTPGAWLYGCGSVRCDEWQSLAVVTGNPDEIARCWIAEARGFDPVLAGACHVVEAKPVAQPNPEHGCAG